MLKNILSARRLPSRTDFEGPRRSDDLLTRYLMYSDSLRVSASQAENAGSIPVARSRDFVAEPNDYMGF